eukprot:13000045-Heterocapsa_arctica.AAC.1
MRRGEAPTQRGTTTSQPGNGTSPGARKTSQRDLRRAAWARSSTTASLSLRAAFRVERRERGHGPRSSIVRLRPSVVP